MQLATIGESIAIDEVAVLKALKLDPRDPATQALVLTCRQYDLDPVLKHMVLIQSVPYVTHRGLWHIAHRSGELDGCEVLEHGDTQTEWWARVAIWRKGWSRPMIQTGRYPKSGTNKAYGPEMAVTRAECLALRRLFDVGAPVQEEQDWPTPSTQPAATSPATLEPVKSDAQIVLEFLTTADTERQQHAKQLAASYGAKLTLRALADTPKLLGELATWVANGAPLDDVVADAEVVTEPADDDATRPF